MNVLPSADLDEEVIARKVLAERVKVFTERAFGGAFSSFLGTLLLAWIQAPVAGLTQSVAWFLCINVVEILIIVWGYQYRVAQPSDQEVPGWARRQIACALLLGLAWGSSVWFFWVDGQILFYVVNLTVLVTVTALTLTIVAPFASATLLFTAGILLPIVTQLAVTSNPLALQVGAGLVVLFLVQVRYAAIARQQLLAGLDTAARNAYLAERLRVGERQMLIAQQISGTGSWVYDLATQRIWASAEGLRIFGYPPTAGDFPIEEIEACIPERERVHQALLALINTGSVYDLEYAIHPADGSPARLVHSIARLERNEQDGTSLVLGFIQDITKSKELEEQVRQLAFYDSLTKLANRHLLNDRLGQTLVANQRNACFAALMFMDLDNFKPLNDTHGHAVGDLLLVEVANRLIQCVRKGDTVARFGGDEFVVVLNALDQDPAIAHAQAQWLAEKICSSLAEPYRLKIPHKDEADTVIEHHCSASIGVVVFMDHVANPDDLLKRADAAMYQAKQSGRNAVRFDADANLSNYRPVRAR
jgi:diguanylate cyclase (GGDEF)-like protein